MTGRSPLADPVSKIMTHTRRTPGCSTPIRGPRRTLAVGSATAMGAFGLLGMPSVALADPMIPLSPDTAHCRQFGFPGHSIKLESPKNHENLEFSASGPDVATRAVLRNQGGQDSGNIRGSIKGRNVYLSVDFDHIGSRVWTGTVDDRGTAVGTTSDGKQWLASFGLPCIDELVPAPAPRAPAPQPQPPATSCDPRVDICVH
jgi:hypothetical protein